MKKLKTILFWTISYTWGIVMTLVGSLLTLGLLITKHKPFRVGPTVCFEVEWIKGGVSFGPFNLVQVGANPSTVLHEAGHSLQNIIWGPLFLIVIFIPSLTRYWVRRVGTPEFRFSILGSITVFTILPVFVPLFILRLTLGFKVFGLLSIVWVIYGLAIFFWQALAIKRYSILNTEPPYNSIWFENQAESFGKVIYCNW